MNSSAETDHGVRLGSSSRLAIAPRLPDAWFVDATLADLTDEQRRWVLEDEALWRRAHAIAARHPGMDVSGVHHVLCNLRRSPEERLRRSLGRLRPDRG
jgi:hypothetical protein